MMSAIYFKRLLVTLMTIAVYLSFLTQSMAAEEKPLVAFLNEKIQTQDDVIVVEKVVIYPDERSLYGLGEENYGMPVKEEYGKGPIVVLYMEKHPDYPQDSPFGDGWIKVELFSDGRRLSQKGSGGIGSRRMVFGFSFWAKVDMKVSPDGAVDLKELGALELKVTVSRIEKVFDIPLHNIPRSKDPIFEDEDVQIWEVRWSKFLQDNVTSLGSIRNFLTEII